MLSKKIRQTLAALLVTACFAGSAAWAQNTLYIAHVGGIGWLDWVGDGQIAGTTGQRRAMEAVEIFLNNGGLADSIEYRAHVGGIGWMDWVSDGSVAGTTGQHRQMEAIQIGRVNPIAGYSLHYRTHLGGLGWQPWVGDWEVSGTTGQHRQMEALQVVIEYPATVSAPAFEPNFWNDDSFIMSHNNCYNYSSNSRTDTFAQPGRGSGQMYASITGGEMVAAAIRDGLEPTNASSQTPGGKMKVALVIAPGYDFHWYRQGSDGLWSHKPGSTSSTNVDNSGNLIFSPETANRGPYTQFWGYFFAPISSIQGVGYANIK